MFNMKCGACGSQNLTGYLDYASFETHVRIKGAASGWLDRGTAIKPEKARICRDCGNVMIFVNAPGLKQLDGQ